MAVPHLMSRSTSETIGCNSVLCTSADVEGLGRSVRVHQKPNKVLKGHKAKFQGKGTQGSKKHKGWCRYSKSQLSLVFEIFQKRVSNYF